jgi:hypothetical protein
MSTENNLEHEVIESHLLELEEDINKIEKQFIIKKDLDQLYRNVHALDKKSKSLNLKSLITKPKLLELIKKNAVQDKRNKKIFVESHGENKFKFKSIKEKNKIKVSIPIVE